MRHAEKLLLDCELGVALLVPAPKPCGRPVLDSRREIVSVLACWVPAGCSPLLLPVAEDEHDAVTEDGDEKSRSGVHSDGEMYTVTAVSAGGPHGDGGLRARRRSRRRRRNRGVSRWVRRAGCPGNGSRRWWPAVRSARVAAVPSRRPERERFNASASALPVDLTATTASAFTGINARKPHCRR